MSTLMHSISEEDINVSPLTQEEFKKSLFIWDFFQKFLPNMLIFSIDDLINDIPNDKQLLREIGYNLLKFALANFEFSKKLLSFLAKQCFYTTIIIQAITHGRLFSELIEDYPLNPTADLYASPGLTIISVFKKVIEQIIQNTSIVHDKLLLRSKKIVELDDKLKITEDVEKSGLLKLFNKTILFGDSLIGKVKVQTKNGDTIGLVKVTS